MRFMDVIKSAPPPAQGHGRAYRIDVDGFNRRPWDLAIDGWNGLPTPDADLPMSGQRRPDLYAAHNGWKFAAHEHTFLDWWPEEHHEKVAEGGGYLLVLDIPMDKMIAMNMQVVFDMDAAKIVASTKEH